MGMGMGTTLQRGLTAADDQYCNASSSSITAPAFALSSHSNPSGLVFYTTLHSEGRWGFPDQYIGAAFIALYGTSESDTLAPAMQGFQLLMVNFTEVNGTRQPSTKSSFLYFNGSSDGMTAPQNDITLWNRRLVDVAVGTNGELFMSDEQHGLIYLIRYVGIKEGELYIRLEVEGNITAVPQGQVTDALAKSLVNPTDGNKVNVTRIAFLATVPLTANTSLVYLHISKPLRPGGEPVRRIKRNIEEGHVQLSLGEQLLVRSVSVSLTSFDNTYTPMPTPTSPMSTPGPSPTAEEEDDSDGGPERDEDEHVPYAAFAYTDIAATIFSDVLFKPRGLAVATDRELLVANSANGTVLVLFDDDRKGKSDALADEYDRAVLATVPNNDPTLHSILINGGYLYASTATTVYRWLYTPGNRSSLGEATVVVQNIPNSNDAANPVTSGAAMGHTSRGLYIDSASRLYVQVGSASISGNDILPWRSCIVRFDLTRALPLDFPNEKEVFATGLRNTPKLVVDPFDPTLLWGADQATWSVSRDDSPVDYTNEPLDELNSFKPSSQGLDYGYPWCWSSNATAFLATPTQRGLFPSNDSYCSSEAVMQPRLALSPHSGPSGIAFYETSHKLGRWSFPDEYVKAGDAFIAMYGTSEQDQSTTPLQHGFRLLKVHFTSDANGGRLPQYTESFFFYNGSSERLDVNQNNIDNWNLRLVDVVVGYNGEIYISDELHGKIYLLRYVGIKPGNVSLQFMVSGDARTANQTAMKLALSESLANPTDGNAVNPARIHIVRIDLVTSPTRRHLLTQMSVVFVVISQPLVPGGEPVLRIQQNIQSSAVTPSLGSDLAILSVEVIDAVPLFTPTPTPALASPGSSSSSSLSGGAIAGIVIGCLAGVLIITMVVVLIANKVKARRRADMTMTDLSAVDAPRFRLNSMSVD